MAELWACLYRWHDCVITLLQRAAATDTKCNSAIMEFTCKISVDIFSIDYFFLTYGLISISHTVLISIYSFSSIHLTSTQLITFHMFLYMLGLTQCGCQSNVSSRFSISQPSCRRLWRRRMGLPQVTVHRVPIQRIPTTIPHTHPWVCASTFFYNSMFQTLLRGQVFLFQSLLWRPRLQI